MTCNLLESSQSPELPFNSRFPTNLFSKSTLQKLCLHTFMTLKGNYALQYMQNAPPPLIFDG